MHEEFDREAAQTFARLPGFIQKRIRSNGMHFPLRREKREGWRGALPFYLFLCSECEHVAKGYPNGYAYRHFLICSHCGSQHNFTPLWATLLERFRDFCERFTRNRNQAH